MVALLPDCFEHVPRWVQQFTVGMSGVFYSLASELRWEQPTMRMFGREVKAPRQIALLGDAGYSYSGIGHLRQPWHPFALAIRDRLEHDTGAPFNSCLVNLYRDGQDSVSWHADDEPELGDEPVIASVSLGETRRFAIKEHATLAGYPDPRRWAFPLTDGDLLVMRGRSQADYLHAVHKTARPVGPRINLTFRVITSR